MLDLTLLLATPIAKLLLDQFFEGPATIRGKWVSGDRGVAPTGEALLT